MPAVDVAGPTHHSGPDPALLHQRVLRWFAAHARDLPWRRADASPWAVFVSEVMLQQTPVVRVLPAYDAWMARWPAPAALAAATPGDAVRQWARLGYPRRALRLHQAATAIVERHAGQVPAAYDDLRALPGVGDYTAAAVASFAFGHRHAVLDTNVRRVLARLLSGVAQPPTTPTRAERGMAERALPAEAALAARWAAATMELGALVCTARTPRCTECPVAAVCAWQRAGRPPGPAPLRRAQPYAGTDRQARGALLAVLREASGPVDARTLAAAWPDGAQQRRALTGLLDDGLVERCAHGSVALPGTVRVGAPGAQA